MGRTLLNNYQYGFSYSTTPRTCYILDHPKRTLLDYAKEFLNIGNMCSTKKISFLKDVFEDGVIVGWSKDKKTMLIVNESKFYKSGPIISRIISQFRHEYYLIFEPGVLLFPNILKILDQIHYVPNWGLVGVPSKQIPKKDLDKFDFKFHNFLLRTDMQRHDSFVWQYFQKVGILGDYGVLYIEDSVLRDFPFDSINTDYGFIRNYIMYGVLKSETQITKDLYHVKSMSTLRIGDIYDG